jgi:branched-chain amino acid transport system substrate-binding protein
LPAGVTLDFIIRDDGGPNPDKAKQLAQELIVRDKVQLLAGAGFTPNAIAIAPLATQSKTPFLVLNAGASVVTTKSPYITRFSFTMAQSASPLGTWAAKKYKSVYTLVADYGPGVDVETAFSDSYKAAGGTIAGSVRVPPMTLEFAPFLQRVKDAKPEAMMVFVPSGKTAAALVKGFIDLGLKDAGIKMIGTGDVVSDEELVNMPILPLSRPGRRNTARSRPTISRSPAGMRWRRSSPSSRRATARSTATRRWPS